MGRRIFFHLRDPPGPPGPGPPFLEGGDHPSGRASAAADDDEWPRAISKFADNDCLHYEAIVHSNRVWSLAKKKSPKAIKDAHFQSTGSQTWLLNELLWNVCGNINTHGLPRSKETVPGTCVLNCVLARSLLTKYRRIKRFAHHFMLECTKKS